jgi:hypothetical protein
MSCWSYPGNWFNGHVAVAYGNVYVQFNGDLVALNISSLAAIAGSGTFPTADVTWEAPGCWCVAGPTVAKGVI